LHEDIQDDDPDTDYDEALATCELAWSESRSGKRNVNSTKVRKTSCHAVIRAAPDADGELSLS
jgi:hypothetical protein